MIQAAPRGTSACGPGTKHSLRAFEGMHEELQRQIQRIAEECAAPGWDGYGASPVTPEAVAQARLFAEAIPTELPTPTIGVEPDGAFTFEWYRNPRLLLSVSVDASAALPYAAGLPRGTISGTEIFHGRDGTLTVEAPRKLANLDVDVLIVPKRPPAAERVAAWERLCRCLQKRSAPPADLGRGYSTGD